VTHLHPLHPPRLKILLKATAYSLANEAKEAFGWKLWILYDKKNLFVTVVTHSHPIPPGSSCPRWIRAPLSSLATTSSRSWGSDGPLRLARTVGKPRLDFSGLVQARWCLRATSNYEYFAGRTAGAPLSPGRDDQRLRRRSLCRASRGRRDAGSSPECVGQRVRVTRGLALGRRTGGPWRPAVPALISPLCLPGSQRVRSPASFLLPAARPTQSAPDADPDMALLLAVQTTLGHGLVSTARGQLAQDPEANRARARAAPPRPARAPGHSRVRARPRQQPAPWAGETAPPLNVSERARQRTSVAPPAAARRLHRRPKRMRGPAEVWRTLPLLRGSVA
jgi:hypothetical protein